MTKKIRERLDGAEDGFTLIELLVVVIIIGILAAIAIPTFLSQRERGWQAELTSGVRNVALEVEAEATSNGGSYLGLEADADAAFAALLGASPITPQAAAGFTQNAFSICASHDNITAGTGANNVTYDSANGGLLDYAEAAC